jgi:polar amino acid transport system permease protein
MDFIDSIYSLIVRYRADLLNATVLTLELTIASFTIGFVLGLLISVGRTYGHTLLKVPLATFIEIIRGTPMIVQLFYIYYVLPAFGVKLDALTASLVAIGLNSSAYQAEYFRMSFGAIQRGQWEAALSIGLSKWSAVFNIIIPQGLRIVIPALLNELIYLLKYSSVAYFVTVPELIYTSKIIGARTLLHLQIYTVVAVFYIVVSTLFTTIMSLVEKKSRIPGLVIRGRETF